MPELPEVEALAGFLRERAVGSVVAAVEVAAVSVLKTHDPPPSALAGQELTGVVRRGTWLDLDVSGLHLCVHMARAGWLRWSESLPAAAARPGRGVVALRVRLDDGAVDERLAAQGRLPGFDLTEAGPRKELAVHVARDPRQVPAIAALGPDPLDPAFDVEALAALLTGSRQQVEGLLRDQTALAGVGDACSDEVLHAARLSPFALAGRLGAEEVQRLWTALREVLPAAVAASAGRPAAELEDAQRAGMRVHGRTGEPCPACGDVVREVSFADRSLQYCATCQTGGVPLADRRTSRFLR
ncbi:DNA-formamidopyrimidine glycosylase family protein [Quadrisphaera sp. DSM 44207]|uniref:DNA-formamidopyrimidine glycosylase family protein n=1 Tax=Quadrisphaera sp. DSM 44207 TaxID=1881057 RepID=UPI000B83C728|nr:DNA-formamidopyrimidine glycosylase family protein [Quadrisphaera sp. DSM 44207]